MYNIEKVKIKIIKHLAVLSPEPLANKSVLGFQAHINTSDSCPLSTVALLAGISIDWSTSIVSGAVGVAASPVVAAAALHVVPCNFIVLQFTRNSKIL